MQIDFHHATTYVVARLAGLPHEAASIVAYAAQYVDDATSSGRVRFDNGASYSRTSSAHKMLDYRNFEELANQHVWLPFHFLPGNGGLPVGTVPPGTFIDRLICRPNSYPAQEMVAAAILQRDAVNALHRLGITMHVYADTWSHQGFAGVGHEINNASDILEEGQPALSLIEKLSSFFVNNANPLGHGTVLSNPDKPYLRWAYRNGRGELVERDNPQDFLAAADHMCVAIRRFLRKDPEASVNGLPEKDREVIDRLIRETVDADGEKRHAVWLEEIHKGAFSFGPATLSYAARGEGSWKFRAIGATEAEGIGDTTFRYNQEFLESDWKLFHDALQAHRFVVIHEILPRYGICTG